MTWSCIAASPILTSTRYTIWMFSCFSHGNFSYRKFSVVSMTSQSTVSEEVSLAYLINSSSLTLVYLDFKWDHLASSSVSELYCREKHFLHQNQVWWPLEWHQVGIRQGKSSNSTFCSRTWYEQFLIIATSILYHSLYTYKISPSLAITHLFSKSESTEGICVTFTGFCNCLLWEWCWSPISIPFLRGNYQNSEHSLQVGLGIHSKIPSVLQQQRTDYLFHCAVCRGSF